MSDVNLVLDPVTKEQVSKSELKRRLKQRERDLKKASNSQQNLANETDSKLNLNDLDPRLYFENRSKQVLDLKSSGKMYPNKFTVSISISEFIEKYSACDDGDVKDELVTVAGRIHNIRKQSKNLVFYDLHGEGLKIQVMANAQDAKDFSQHDIIQRGDIVGIQGKPGKAKRFIGVASYYLTR